MALITEALLLMDTFRENLRMRTNIFLQFEQSQVQVICLSDPAIGTLPLGQEGPMSAGQTSGIDLTNKPFSWLQLNCFQLKTFPLSAPVTANYKFKSNVCEIDFLTLLLKIGDIPSGNRDLLEFRFLFLRKFWLEIKMDSRSF